MKIIDRIHEYLNYKGVAPTKFEKEIGLSNGYLGIQKKRNADIGEGIILKVIENCRDISPEWLLTGSGNMLKTEEKTRGSIGVVPHTSQQAGGNTPPDPKAVTDLKDITIDKLIKEVKELSAENAVLKLENEKLIKDIKNKSNPCPYSYVAKP